jgi:hypothetical protein
MSEFFWQYFFDPLIYLRIYPLPLLDLDKAWLIPPRYPNTLLPFALRLRRFNNLLLSMRLCSLLFQRLQHRLRRRVFCSPVYVRHASLMRIRRRTVVVLGVVT